MEARCGKLGHFKGQWKEICVWQLKQTHSERTEAFQSPCVISANSKQTSWIPQGASYGGQQQHLGTHILSSQNIPRISGVKFIKSKSKVWPSRRELLLKLTHAVLGFTLKKTPIFHQLKSPLDLFDLKLGVLCHLRYLLVFEVSTSVWHRWHRTTRRSMCYWGGNYCVYQEGYPIRVDNNPVKGDWEINISRIADCYDNPLWLQCEHQHCLGKPAFKYLLFQMDSCTHSPLLSVGSSQSQEFAGLHSAVEVCLWSFIQKNIGTLAMITRII